MTPAGRANALAFLGVLALTAFAAWRQAPPLTSPPAEMTAPPVGRRVPLSAGGFALPDASGHLVPLRSYRRIASGTAMTDRLLLALCEPDRIVAFSQAGAATSPWAYQLAGKPTVEGLRSLEPLIALKPDLVLTSSLGSSENAARLRATGVEVFDVGELRGMSSLLSLAGALSELLGHPERGAHFTRAFQRRMQRVTVGLGDRPRKRALYLEAIGPFLYGGTRGTSYHDVLRAAGLEDAAADTFADWPAYSAEQLLGLRPELVVTKEGMGRLLCARSDLESLAACRDPAGIVELPAGLLDEPGPAMLDAAEILFDRVYGERPSGP